MQFNLKWSDLKNFATSRNISVQWVVANKMYLLAAIDGPLEATAQIPITTPPGSDQTDFETNFKDNGNQPLLSKLTTVTTQFEMNNKDLKLARATAAVDNTQTAVVYLKVPGQFGTTDGRYVAGGYAITADYNAEDYATVRIEDKDRLIALALAQAQDPTATEPLPDSAVQSAGPIPGFGAFPEYPILKSYTDDDADPENRGWYFWPLAQGDNLPPVGEIDIEPIGGYGFIPAGFYLAVSYCRTVSTGSVNVNVWWGKLE